MITALRNSFIGLIKPSQHTENSSLKGGWMFLLIFILSIITAVLFCLPINKLKKDISLDNLPEFTYSNGELTVDKKLTIPLEDKSRGNILFVVETDSLISDSTAADSIDQLAKSYDCYRAMYIAKDGMIIYQYGQSTKASWDSVFPKDMVVSNANIKEYIIKFVNIVILVCSVTLSILYIVIYYFCLLIYTIIGLIINSILKTDYSFGGLYKTFFSVALPLWLLKAVLCMLLTGGMDKLVKWLVRIAIILYFFFALYLKNKEDEQMAMQAAAVMNSNTDDLDINSFVSSHEMDDDFR